MINIIYKMTNVFSAIPNFQDVQVVLIRKHVFFVIQIKIGNQMPIQSAIGVFAKPLLSMIVINVFHVPINYSIVIFVLMLTLVQLVNLKITLVQILILKENAFV
jgi:hypothetical protein